jgi:hypothetical protein
MDNAKNDDTARGAELRELVDFEVGDIVSTAQEQGFTARATLDALAASVAARSAALDDTTDADNSRLPAGPHSKPELVDRDKTSDMGALPEATGGEVDPGVG